MTSAEPFSRTHPFRNPPPFTHNTNTIHITNTKHLHVKNLNTLILPLRVIRLLDVPRVSIRLLEGVLFRSGAYGGGDEFVFAWGD